MLVLVSYDYVSVYRYNYYTSLILIFNFIVILMANAPEQFN